MNKHFLKNIRDNMPEPLKYLTAPIFRNKLIKNKDYILFEKLLEKRKTLSKDEIFESQVDNLKKILIYSFNNIPYYKELFNQVGFIPKLIRTPEDIKIIPYLTKDIIRQNFDKLKSTHKINGGHYIATTGGSTGEPLKLLLDFNCVFKENAFVNHYRKKIGYQINDRIGTFRGVEFGDKLWKYNPMQNELIFSPFKISQKTISIYVAKLDEFRPCFLNGYLSSLTYFARLLSENGLKLKYPIKGIFLISENIDEEQREFLENFFKVKSSTFYGHSERCIIGEEKGSNEYIFDPYYGFTELINTSDDTFEIVGTGFLNLTMPLIRYRTNDLCSKTKNNTVIIHGRWDVKDYLLGLNEEKVFHSAFNFHSEIFKNITNYQFVQTEKGLADMLLVPNKKFNINEIELMKIEINKKTKGVIDFTIKVTDKLILTNRGKFKMFNVDVKS